MGKRVATESCDGKSIEEQRMSRNDINGFDVVIVGQQAWDTDIGSNCKNIAMELAKTNRVLYVNSPLDRFTYYRRRNDQWVKTRIRAIKNRAPSVTTIQDNLWVLYPDCLVESVNWLNSRRIFDFFNRRNNRKFAAAITRGLESLGFGDIILFNDNEIFKAFYLSEMLTPSLSVYYSRDFMLAVDYWKKHGKVLEPLLIGESDVCVANSEYLSDYCKQYNPNSYYVGQGCDLEMFDIARTVKATDVSVSKGPVVGYVGALYELRLDIQVLLHIAISRPEWNLVLVGPESEVFKESQLHALSNVKFVGKRKPEELASYIQLFDVCINPQVINEVTIGNYPRKIDEYLAMGKPVVATHTRAMEFFSDYVYLCSSKEDYIAQIEKAMKENSSQKEAERSAFASAHTWENSVNAIKMAIANHI